MAFIGGGAGNRIATNAYFGVIGGGSLNNALGEYAMIPGGRDNSAGRFGFAAGTGARALHDGSFVWADSSGANLVSTTSHQFSARASGGVRFFTDAGATTGVELAPGSGAWSMLSDRNAKENFSAVNPRSILDKVASLSLATWNYKSQDKAIRHIGPTAQDFHAAFGVGENERTIATVDTDGVALAAIQGLNQKFEEQLKAKDAHIETLEQRIARLENLISNLT